jgi:hypothetical protein
MLVGQARPWCFLSERGRFTVNDFAGSGPIASDRVAGGLMGSVAGGNMTMAVATSTSLQARKPQLRRKLLSFALCMVGIATLSYLLGATVMFFEVPPSGFLTKAFIGARAWEERRQAISRTVDERPAALIRNEIHQPDKVFPGYTLCVFASMTNYSTQALLLDVKGEPVHRWAASFNKVWPNPPHLPDPVHESLVAFFSCHLFPNGDLLVVFHGLENGSMGYGLAKFDKDSNLIWKYSARVHHDVDVGEDGSIYAIKNEIVNEMPKGLENIPTPCLADYLVVLSPEGKELSRPIPILDALRDSPYALLLSPLLQGRPGRHVAAGVPLDVLHTNCVTLLSRDAAPKFPFLKAGQVLISLRELDALIGMDPQTGSVVWAATGPWRHQHDPQFLGNGHLLLFDNRGLGERSRVLEYDPKNQTFPWWYSGQNRPTFNTATRGMCQRLPNGNTLIVNSEGQELLEVTLNKEVVWSCSFDAFICFGRRYSPDELPFLNENGSTHH